MTYYETLLQQVGKSMKKHPHSTMVMDYGSLKVVASGVNTKKLGERMRHKKTISGVSVVFQRPSEKAVWVL
jgi:hypothetical protein